MITFSEYYDLLVEDLQSSLNQAKRIFKSNGFSDKFADSIGNIVKEISRSNRLTTQQKRFNTDSNIPILAYLLITNTENGLPPIETLKNDYIAYLTSPRATGQNILVNYFTELKNTIQQNKWFAPSDEKRRYIWEWGNKLITKIHEYQVSNTEQVNLNKNDTEDVVYEDDKIIVYKADSKAKCIKYGAGSSLCISVKGGGNYYWSYRMGNMRNDGLGMTTYFVYWKDGSNRILIDALGNEDGPANKYSWNPITPNADKDMTAMSLIAYYPDLADPFIKKVFQFIPYSEKEERFNFIEQNVKSILDDELRTIEDYDMYIEGIDGDNFDEYGDIIYTTISFKDFKTLEKKLGKNNVAYLAKKYAGLGNIIDGNTINNYLSESDKNWYFDILIEDMDTNYEYSNYFIIMKNTKGSIPEKIIHTYFSNYDFREGVSNTNYVEEMEDGAINDASNYSLDAIGNFIKDSIINIDSVWQYAKKLYNYMVIHHINQTDFFFGKNVNSDLVSKVFSNFSYDINYDLPDLLFALIEYYKRNNIIVPKILFKCILNDTKIAAKYLYKWYRSDNYVSGSKISKKLIDTISKSKSSIRYILGNLRYDIMRGRLEIGEDIPVEFINVLKNDKSGMYVDLLFDLDNISSKHNIF